MKILICLLLITVAPSTAGALYDFSECTTHTTTTPTTTPTHIDCRAEYMLYSRCSFGVTLCSGSSGNFPDCERKAWKRPGGMDAAQVAVRARARLGSGWGSPHWAGLATAFAFSFFRFFSSPSRRRVRGRMKSSIRVRRSFTSGRRRSRGPSATTSCFSSSRIPLRRGP